MWTSSLASLLSGFSEVGVQKFCYVLLTLGTSGEQLAKTGLSMPGLTFDLKGDPSNHKEFSSSAHLVTRPGDQGLSKGSPG